jgi:hypothetical protein
MTRQTPSGSSKSALGPMTDNGHSRVPFFVEGREELRARNRKRAALRNRGHDVKRNLVRRRAPLHVTQAAVFLALHFARNGSPEGHRVEALETQNQR